MTKYGWIILGLIVVALAGYVFWPEGGAVVVPTPVLAGRKPDTYTLVAGGLTQEISPGRVRLAGHDLPLEAAKSEALWNHVAFLHALPERIRVVAPADLASYGIDPARRRLTGGDVDLSWGTSGEDGYCHDVVSGRLFVIGIANARRLDALAVRLDRARLLAIERGIDGLSIDGVHLESRGGELHVAGAPWRTAFSARVRTLAMLISDLALGDLAATVPVDARLVATLGLSIPPGRGENGAVNAPAEHHIVRLFQRADAGLASVDGLPPQSIEPLRMRELTAALAAFAEDRLFAVGDPLQGHAMKAAIVWRAGVEWFRLESRTRELDDQTSTWDIVWSGGREVAEMGAADRLIAAINELAVAGLRMCTPFEEPWPGALAIELRGPGMPRTVLELAPGMARSATQVGRIVRLPPLLADLAPDRFLDTLIVGKPVDRIAKLQRQIHDQDPVIREAYVRSASGTWERTFPAPASADQQSLQRLARAIAQARGLDVRFAGPADRAILDRPAIEVDLRFSAKGEGKAHDMAAVEDTVAQDWGLAIGRVDGLWRAVDKDGVVAWRVDDEFVELMREALADRLVLPLVPSQVKRLRVAAVGAEAYELAPVAGRWRIGAASSADDVEVRRLLRRLANLQANRQVPGTALAVVDRAGSLFIDLPSIDAPYERLTLHIGKPGAAGAAADEVALSAESSRADALPLQCSFLPATVLDELLPGRERFVE
ncbi:MAG: hypothetical protein H0W72_07825 [Planctomycetes bacterium]|nr:hypothetical protein [Planctomycetota bacterium]